MINLTVEVEDWDTGKSTELTLPCDVQSQVDTSHELFITDSNEDFAIGYYYDILELNNLIDDINAECPSMTVDILNAILEASDEYCLNSDEFIRKICASDYMLERITDIVGKTDEEKCAHYLLTELNVPFARNITDDIIGEMCSNQNLISWETVWKHYKSMGFKKLLINNNLYAFHWGDAVEE